MKVGEIWERSHPNLTIFKLIDMVKIIKISKDGIDFVGYFPENPKDLYWLCKEEKVGFLLTEKDFLKYYKRFRNENW